MRSQESELKRHQVIYDLYQPLLANSCNCNNSVGPDTSLLTPPLAGSSNLNFPPKQSTGWKFNTESLKSNHLKSKTVPHAEWWFVAQGQRRSCYSPFRFGIKVKTMFRSKVRVRNLRFRVPILLWEFGKSSRWEIRDCRCLWMSP